MSGTSADYYSPVESCKANEVNPLAYLSYVLNNARNKSFALLTPDEFTGSNIAHVG
jgi:hypothetical protein